MGGPPWRLLTLVSRMCFSDPNRIMEMDEEYWFQICKQAVSTTDPDDFAWIIRDINRMLYEKQLQLKKQGQDDIVAA